MKPAKVIYVTRIVDACGVVIEAYATKREATEQAREWDDGFVSNVSVTVHKYILAPKPAKKRSKAT